MFKEKKVRGSTPAGSTSPLGLVCDWCLIIDSVHEKGNLEKARNTVKTSHQERTAQHQDVSDRPQLLATLGENSCKSELEALILIHK